MKITFHIPEGASRYPGGYWLASTDDGGYDGLGPDPLTAVSALVVQIEAEALRGRGSVTPPPLPRPNPARSPGDGAW